MKKKWAWRSGFTLIELLVVIITIGIMAGLLLPALVRARERGQLVKCRSNQAHIIMACLMYADDRHKSIPPSPLPESFNLALPGLWGDFIQART